MRRIEEDIIDVHTHATGIDILNYFTPRVPSTQSLLEIRGKLTRYGISQAVVFPFPGSLYYNPRLILEKNIWEPSGMEDFPYQQANMALLAEIRIRGLHEQFLPFLAIDPLEKADEQIQYLRSEQGYFGIKVHTLATRSSPQDIGFGFLTLLRERNIPITFHTGKEGNVDPLFVIKFAQENPDIRVSLAHLAGLNRDALTTAAQVENLFVDTSPFVNICYFGEKGWTRYIAENRLTCDFSDPVAVMIQLYRLLPEKLIWGTDDPFSSFSNRKGELVTDFSYKDEVAVLDKLWRGGYKEVVKKIAYYNIHKFLFGH